MLPFLVLTSLSAYQPTEPSEVRALQAEHTPEFVAPYETEAAARHFLLKVPHRPERPAPP